MAREFLLDRRAAIVEQMEAYAYEEADFARLGDEVAEFTSPYFGQFATLRFGIARGNAALEWCDWLLDRLPAQAGSASVRGEVPAGS